MEACSTAQATSVAEVAVDCWLEEGERSAVAKILAGGADNARSEPWASQDGSPLGGAQQVSHLRRIPAVYLTGHWQHSFCPS